MGTGTTTGVVGIGGSTSPYAGNPKDRRSLAAQLPPPKRKKTNTTTKDSTVATRNVEVGVQADVEMLDDVSLRLHLNVNKMKDGSVEGPMKTAWDFRYPVNRVLRSAVVAGNADRVTTMGFGQIMVAIKTYSL